MCMPKVPKANALPTVQVAQAPQAADTAVVEARSSERRRISSQRGGASTDVTGGQLSEASTSRKTALGQ